MKKFTRKIYLLSLLSAAILYSCNGMFKQEKKTWEYDLDKPEKFFMPESLAEISGIALYKGRSDTIYVNEDENGKVFRLAWKEKKQYNTKFSKKGDFEDLCFINNTIIVLKSNGHLYSFPVADTQLEETTNTAEWKNLLPEGEYEGMYGDDSTSSLYIVCKNCPADDNKDMVSGYILHWGDSVYVSGKFSIDVNAIKAFTGKVKRGFRPSALAKNPLTGEWFVVSAVNNLLVVADRNWKIKEAYPLNSNTFNQPEGIAFDTAGNLYISNEGDKITDGNVLKFLRLKK